MTSNEKLVPHDGADGEVAWTVGEALQHIGSGMYHYRLFVITGMCFMADAVEAVLLSYLQTVLSIVWDLGYMDASTLSAIVFAGQFVGALIFGRIADHYGRRIAFLISAIVVFVFGVLSAVAPSYIWLVLARAGVGIGIGGFTVPFDLLAEILPPENRGKYLMAFEYFWTAGACLITGVAWIILPAGGIAWRWLVFAAAVPVGISCLFYFIVPESPTYLAAWGRCEEAKAVLAEVARVNGVTLPPNLRILPPVIPDKEESYADLFTPELRRTTFVTWALWACGAFAYYGIVLVTPSLFHDSSAHGAYKIDYLGVFVASAAEFLGTTFTLFIVDRWGRKWTNIVTFGMVCGFTILMLINNFPFFIACAMGSRMAIMAATSSVWIYTPEVFPTPVRGIGHSTANACGRVGAFITPYVAQAAIAISMEIPIVAYAAAGLLATIASILIPFETAGKPMQEHHGGKDATGAAAPLLQDGTA